MHNTVFMRHKNGNPFFVVLLQSSRQTAESSIPDWKWKLYFYYRLLLSIIAHMKCDPSEFLREIFFLLLVYFTQSQFKLETRVAQRHISTSGEEEEKVVWWIRNKKYPTKTWSREQVYFSFFSWLSSWLFTLWLRNASVTTAIIFVGFQSCYY